MHIAIIGATALILFLIMGGMFVVAVVLEQRTRRQIAAAAASAQGAQSESVAEPAEAPKAMTAAAGR
jgi:hypothetical protein